MSEHLSAFQLDEIYAGLAPEAAALHAAQCAVCQEKLKQAAEKRDAARGAPRFTQIRAQLPAPSRRRWPLLLLAVPVAALLLVIPARAWRTKGRHPAVKIRHEGKLVDLHIDPASYRYVLVFEGSKILWPAGSQESGEVPANHAVELRLEATGSSLVETAFSNRPVRIGELPEKDVEVIRSQVEP